MGVYTMSDTGKYCYLASCDQTQYLQPKILNFSSPSDSCPRYEHALQSFTQACGSLSSNFNINDASPHYMKSLAALYFGVIKENIPSSFALTIRDSNLWQCNRMKHAKDFLKEIPIVGLNQSVGPRKFMSVLQYRFGIPLFAENSVCPSCDRPMDIYGGHAVHCESGVGNKFRHDSVCDVFSDICYRAGVTARKEVDLGFLSDNANALKPADILVYNWEDGKDVCFDVTGVSPFTSARTCNFTPCQAITSAVTRKCAKCLDK